MRYHMAAFFGGFLLDLILGDPYALPHPVRLIGRMTAGIEKKVLKQNYSNKKKFYLGAVMAWLVLGGTLTAAFSVWAAGYWIHPWVGMTVELIMTYQILAARCLQMESMKVYRALKEGRTEEARQAVSMIVGRDTAVLDEEGIARAAIETVAENTSDGVIAPMIYTALGGPVLGFLYKSVNTMDSMVGYKNEKYLYFGRAAAKLDDFVNYIPARISAWLMIGAAFLGGKEFSGKRAVYIYRRDNRKHASPNSAQTEAVCAGALGIRLAGDASYFGKIVKKPYIGDSVRKVEWEDIKRANKLMYWTAWLGEIFCLSGMVLIQYYSM